MKSDIIYSKKFMKREGTNRQRAEVSVQQLTGTSYEVAVRLNGEETPDEFMEINVLEPGRSIKDMAEGACMGLRAAGFDDE